MKNCKAVIFDLDGTLLDTLADLADSMNAVLQRLDCPPHNQESYKYFIGDGVKTLAQRVLPADRFDLIDRCVSEMLREYDTRWADKTRLYPGVNQLLDNLLEHGLTLNILSNKPDLFTQKTVKRFLNHWSFARVFGARENFPRKPDPAGALEIAKHVDISADQFFYLGDTDTDMKTATAAGMYPVGVLWGFRSEDELKKSGAKLIIEHPTDLLDYL